MTDGTRHSSSALQPLVEAMVDPCRPVPDFEHRQRDHLETEAEMRVLGRACSNACGLAVRLFAGRSASQIAADLSVREGFDEIRAAFAEDCLVVQSVSTRSQEMNPARLMRADSRSIMAGWMEVIAGLARMCAEALPLTALEIVRACFAAADGSPRSV